MTRQWKSMRGLAAWTAALVALGALAGPKTLQARADEKSPKPRIQAGASTSNITPFFDDPIVGNFTTPPAEYVHDELHARAIVLDDGSTKLAIVVSDSVGVSREVFDEARKVASEKTGIPAGNMLLSATHSHSATSSRSKNLLIPNAELSPYQKFLANRVADVIRQANKNLQPARIGWGAVDVPGQVFNRRWLLKPGTTAKNPFGGEDRAQMNPGSNPDKLEPAGPTDPQVSILAIQSPQGKPVALLANYSLHYVGGVPTGHLSGDYFARFADRVCQLIGGDDRADPPFVGIMSNGTSGDVNNNNYAKPSPGLPPYQKMDRVAKEIAEAVAETYRKMPFFDHVPLAAAHGELELATRKPTSEQVEYAKSILKKPEDAPKYHRLERNYAERTLQQADSPDTISVMIQAFRIGDLGIAAIPFEVFAETGLEIKKNSPFKSTFTIELANGTYGYLPTPRHFPLGGYETWMGTNKVEPEASVKIVKTLMDQFHKLDEQRKAK